MAAVSIQFTPQGVRSVVVEQELVFFIGTSPTNSLDDLADYERRVKEIEPLLDQSGERYAELVAIVERAYAVEIGPLKASLRFGGMRGVMSPNLCIDLVATETCAGKPLFTISDPRNGAAICRALISLLDADWVDLWWMGTLGHARLTCERNGKAVWFKSSGKTEEI